MSALVIRWQGPARRRAIGTVLQERVQAWLREWAVEPVPEADVQDLSREDIDAPCWQMGNAPDGACVLAGLDPASIARLGGVLAGAPTRLAGDSRTALAVGHDAVEALFRALVSDVGKLVETPELPIAVLSERHGWTCFQVCFGDIGFALLFDPTLCDHLDPRRSSAAMLEQRSAALSETSVMLNATLELGSVDISLVSSLRPGDILRTDVALSAPLKLGVAGGETVSAGRLMVLDQHKAISVDQLH